MSKKYFLESMRKAKEEEYFRKKEQELLKKMRRRSRLNSISQELEELMDIRDKEYPRDIREQVYRRDAIALLHIVPLVYVGWADDKVTVREKNLIRATARLRGIAENSPSFRQLNSWLEQRPTEEFFKKTLRLLSIIIDSEPDEVKDGMKVVLFSLCKRVAEASGGPGVWSNLSSRAAKVYGDKHPTGI